MARHKKIQTEAQEDPEMNISSMIDCCFLLLIYFLVATSLVSEKKLDINIPATDQSAASEKKPKVDPGKISVRADGSVFWNSDLQVGEPFDPSLAPGTEGYRAQRNMENLVEQLKILKEQADAVETTPVVMLSGASKAAHQRIVDVMAALAAAGIHSVGLSTQAEE